MQIDKVQMKKARTTYGLSAAAMNKICGFGVNTWRLYESGKAEPSKSNMRLLQYAVTPSGMYALLRICPQEIRKELGKKYTKANTIVLEIINLINKRGESVRAKIDEEYFKS